MGSLRYKKDEGEKNSEKIPRKEVKGNGGGGFV